AWLRCLPRFVFSSRVTRHALFLELGVEERQHLLPGILGCLGVIAVSELVLESMICAVIAMKRVLDARLGERRVVCIHVLWRGTFVQIAEESDYRALDVSGKIYRRRIACAHGLPHAPAVEHRARREPGVGHRAHPEHAPAPTVAHQTDTTGTHLLLVRAQA